MGGAVGPEPQWISDRSHVPWVEVGRWADARGDRRQLKASDCDCRRLARGDPNRLVSTGGETSGTKLRNFWQGRWSPAASLVHTGIENQYATVVLGEPAVVHSEGRGKFLARLAEPLVLIRLRRRWASKAVALAVFVRALAGTSLLATYAEPAFCYNAFVMLSADGRRRQ